MNKTRYGLLALSASLASMQAGAQPLPPSPASPPGLYVSVASGQILVTNPAGSRNFSAGQFGYTPNFRQPPVIVPSNPGMQFTPPPVFNSSSLSAPAANGAPARSSGVDCEVR
ncbi:MAG: hypothetical protein ACT6Q9_09160 [Polaromonas sp.]|uniref:hypothetical protein n=1 Tax=Polaromonas sp. TaxID=1869339 RepID=UPI0040375361